MNRIVHLKFTKESHGISFFFLFFDLSTSLYMKLDYHFKYEKSLAHLILRWKVLVLTIENSWLEVNLFSMINTQQNISIIWMLAYKQFENILLPKKNVRYDNI